MLRSDTQSRDALAKQISSWKGGIEPELGFWRRWMDTKGLEWPDDFTQRLQHDTPLIHDVVRLLPPDMKNAIVLDVGSGPLSKIGKIVGDARPRIISCDPLMSQYKLLLDEFGLVPLTECLQAPAEDLSSYFEPNFADVVHCSNALDHSFDPIRGIEEMLYVVKPTGAIVLLHATNEAENENYEGFHQWNFDTEGDRFIVWNRSHRIDLNEHLDGVAHVVGSSSSDRRGVAAIIRKNPDRAEMVTALCDFRRKQRIAALHETLLSVSLPVPSPQPESESQAESEEEPMSAPI